jgi:hypothetical protein
VVAGFLATFVLYLMAEGLGGDRTRIAFWFWFLGAVTTAVALMLCRALVSDRSARPPLTPIRAGAWAAAVVLSLLAVFPPLRDDLARSLRGGSSTDQVDARADVLFPDDN